MVVFMIEQQFNSARKDRKRLFFYLVNEIVLEGNQKDRKTNAHQYIIQFGSKLKSIFHEFCM